jgi:SMC interacting uncharacterized protein involved in chromosome segregation
MSDMISSLKIELAKKDIIIARLEKMLAWPREFLQQQTDSLRKQQDELEWHRAFDEETQGMLRQLQEYQQTIEYICQQLGLQPPRPPPSSTSNDDVRAKVPPSDPVA